MKRNNKYVLVMLGLYRIRYSTVPYGTCLRYILIYLDDFLDNKLNSVFRIGI